MMAGIIRARGRAEILNSSQVKLKVSYLNAVKVYALRCCSQGLAQRLQNK